MIDDRKVGLPPVVLHQVECVRAGIRSQVVRVRGYDRRVCRQRARLIREHRDRVSPVITHTRREVIACDATRYGRTGASYRLRSSRLCEKHVD